MAMPKDLPVIGRSYSECDQEISPKSKDICSLCVKKFIRQKNIFQNKHLGKVMDKPEL